MKLTRGHDAQRSLEWYRRKAPAELWLDVLRHAEMYEEWEEAALHLDNLLGLDLWRYNQVSRYYDYRLINERLDNLAVAREDQDIHALVNLLRSGLVRNLGNITATKLYNRSFAGSKFLIEEYITQVAEAIEFISTLPAVPPSGVGSLGSNSSSGNIAGQAPLPEAQSLAHAPATPAVHFSDNSSTTPGSHASNGSNAAIANTKAPMTMSNQMKLDFVHDTRQAFGRSTLVLQGGAIFGLCHLGVVKALFLRGLLPRIITGTATGALIAALVAIHKEEELPAVLKGDGIDLSAFSTKNRAKGGDSPGAAHPGPSRWQTLLRRVKRFYREGYFLDVKVLEECVRANVGDLTFEEAYIRSKRVLNITVAATGQGGIPTLLNYLTAPNVVSSPGLNFTPSDSLKTLQS
jgi:TAG lipase / lysophosphatidylethanolamine acyltransferase